MKISIFLALMFVAQFGQAEWTLVNHASSVNYFSIKNNIADVNSFTNMDGSISDQGEISIRVDLSSIETNNSKRNLQIQDLFLETKDFQEAVFSIDLGNDFLSKLAFIKASKIPVSATFSLHGVVQNVELNLLLIRLKNDFLYVKTYEPIMLTLTDFNLAEGLERLRKIETFKRITNKVPVSLNLYFNRTAQTKSE